MMAPQVLQLQEIEPPAELAAALSADFLGRLFIANPPPVQIAPLENWTGYCHAQDATDRGEVIISDWRTPPRPLWSIERIQGIYIHETAHRIIGQADDGVKSHGLEFYSLLLFLLSRAGERKGGWSWILYADLYDCQNCIEPSDIPGLPSLGKSIDFSMELALELAGQKITAEQAAEEICRRAKAWREEVAAAPGRREAAQKAAREKFEALQAALRSARDKIFWWRLYFGAAAFLAVAVFFLVIANG
jgi:hypothetical protein